MTDDREELANERDELIELLAEIYGYVGDAIERDSDALLQSDWLARHDRALRAATLRQAATDARDRYGFTELNGFLIEHWLAGHAAVLESTEQPNA